MAGSPSFDWDGQNAALADYAAQVTVCRYDDTIPVGDDRFVVLPNVVCEEITHRQEAEAPLARFRYLLDELALASGFPTQFEELWPIDAQGPYVVKPDDRIVVVSWTPQGSRRILFDGFAQVPQADLTSNSQAVTFLAVGVAVRAWDVPIGGRIQRSANTPNSGIPIQTDLPTRFNPTDKYGRMLPNCTPSGHDENQSDAHTRYPIFLEERIERSPDPRTYWNLSSAIRYILAVHNDETYITNPDFETMDALLKVRIPVEGADTYDPGDPTTYTEEEIPIRDYDATDKPWPEAVATLLQYAGFAMAFRTAEDSGYHPQTWLDIYRTDAASEYSPKVLYLDATGASIDPAANNVTEIHLARDLNAVVNAFSIETIPRRMEVSIVLAPLFTPASGDETSANRPQFLKSKLADATATVKRKYRWYGVDECGDGHYDLDSTSWVTTAFDFDPVFPRDSDGVQSWVGRYRPGSNQLISVDSLQRPRRANLYFSQDYLGTAPGFWDRTGTWYEIGGGWQLLEDRLGIEVTIEDPEQWYASKAKGEIRGITWQANPPAGKQFFLRLTTVIEDDLMVPAVVGMRIASPTMFERRRRVDARDHFRIEEIDVSSFHNTTGDIVTVRDDTDRALDHAESLRAAHEIPPLAGSVTIPFITNAIEVGDRLRMIKGREATLRANNGIFEGERARYPVVVSRTWSFSQGGQSTTLQLSDRRGEPQNA